MADRSPNRIVPAATANTGSAAETSADERAFWEKQAQLTARSHAIRANEMQNQRTERPHQTSPPRPPEQNRGVPGGRLVPGHPAQPAQRPLSTLTPVQRLMNADVFQAGPQGRSIVPDDVRARLNLVIEPHTPTVPMRPNTAPRPAQKDTGPAPQRAVFGTPRAPPRAALLLGGPTNDQLHAAAFINGQVGTATLRPATPPERVQKPRDNSGSPRDAQGTTGGRPGTRQAAPRGQTAAGKRGK